MAALLATASEPDSSLMMPENTKGPRSIQNFSIELLLDIFVNDMHFDGILVLHCFNTIDWRKKLWP
jgi:hypothetical protein